jgi:nucleotide-binding universal stress UspA family protein
MNENNTNLPVIVGYDTSPESAFALEWATRVAQHRGCALRVISAADIDLSSVELARPGIQEMYLDQARQQAQEGADLARTFAAGLEVTSEGQPGSAAGALVNASRQGALLVVGHRVRSLLPDTLLGSVAFKATHHAACPVAIVRKSPRPLPSAAHPVVVGVDGSEHGTRAVHEAARLAADTGSFLRIVVAWQRPSQERWARAVARHTLAQQNSSQRGGAGAQTPLVYEKIVAEIEQRAQRIAQQAADEVRQGHPDLRTELHVCEGAADRVILEASADASMIAVGARGLGDLQNLNLGSISRKVMQQAECAVYLVR